MRILLINSVCGIRSTGRICTDIAKHYIAEGHEVRIAYGREFVPLEYQAISVPIGNKINVYMSALKARLFDNEGFNCKKSTKVFLKWAEEYNPDILWLHNLHGYYLNVEMLFSWIKKRPHMKVNWTLHDCWAFTGHCSHFSYCQCNKWQHGCKKCIQIKRYPQAIRDNSQLNYERKKNAFCGVKNMTLITPSHWLSDIVSQSFLREYSVSVIHNDIDKSVFKPQASDFRQRYNLETKRIVLGVASAWGNSKGLHDFIELSALLDDSYQVVLVGLSKSQKSKLDERIIGISRTNSPMELAGIYTAADVFVNLTYEDTYPTVNLESQACGTPCITYRTGGSPESVPPENVVDRGDLQGIVRKIQSMFC